MVAKIVDWQVAGCTRECERERERERESEGARAREREREKEREGTGVYVTAVSVRLSLWQEDGDGFFRVYAHASQEKKRERKKERKREKATREWEEHGQLTCATISSSTLTKWSSSLPVASLAWSARGILGAGGDPLKEKVNDSSRLWYLRFFFHGQRASEEREKETHESFTHIQRQRKREGEDAHATLTARFVEEGNEERKKRKTDATQRSVRTNAVFTSRRIVPHRVHPRRIEVDRSRISPRLALLALRQGEPSRKGSVDRLVDCLRLRACRLYFFLISFPSLRPSRNVRVHLSLSLSLFLSPPLSYIRALPSSLLTLSLSFSVSLFLSLGRSVRWI